MPKGHSVHPQPLAPPPSCGTHHTQKRRGRGAPRSLPSSPSAALGHAEHATDSARRQAVCLPLRCPAAQLHPPLPLCCCPEGEHAASWSGGQAWAEASGPRPDRWSRGGSSSGSAGVCGDLFLALWVRDQGGLRSGAVGSCGGLWTALGPQGQSGLSSSVAGLCGGLWTALGAQG